MKKIILILTIILLSMNSYAKESIDILKWKNALPKNMNYGRLLFK